MRSLLRPLLALTGTVSYDHPDPCIFTVLTCQSAEPGETRSAPASTFVIAFAADHCSRSCECRVTGWVRPLAPRVYAPICPVRIGTTGQLTLRCCNACRRCCNRRFCDIPASLGRWRPHVPAAVFPSQLHDRVRLAAHARLCMPPSLLTHYPLLLVASRAHVPSTDY